MDCMEPFFKMAILPELMGKFYSRDSELSSSSTTSSEETNAEGSDSTSNSVTYCYCNGPEEGDMVGCDNADCQHEWFHLKCLGLKFHPKSKTWYCPDCQKLPNFRRKQNKIGSTTTA